MKLKFKNQQYQADAASAVVNCFLGQTKGHRKEIVDRTELLTFEIFSNKKLEITEPELLKNVQDVQKDNGLRADNKLEGLNFSIEMETGTGKTYVYTKTIYELNKEYGWSKFIIMVPSVAIREGVHKSLEITAEHFQEQYGKKIRFFIYNTQNKSNLVNIKSFANTSNIEVIIINYQAFATNSKESRKIYQKLDSLQSEKPIDIIKRARPILIIDEPQKFGPKTENTLKEFNPLFILRYSATHKKDYNKIYRLDAIDAYNQKLVKKINVKGIEVVGNSGTNSYLFLDSINVSKDKYPTANLEFEVKQGSGIRKVIRKVQEKDDLYSPKFSNELAQYKGFVVKEINALKNRVIFTNGIEIYVGQSIGDVDEEHVRRIQIREAISSHIEKEKVMFEKGIKVLSLFFIDEVAKYKKYDSSNNTLNGEYANIFEEEYVKTVQQQELFNKEYFDYINKYPANKIHNGYFSIDKKGRLTNSTENRTEGGSDDVDAYDLIMKNKEKLLSFKEPTRFIFSHSALREGWDNPNIFQICTLKHSQSNISKRQEIGRGLRICVDSNGERMDASVLDTQFFDYNTLTVIASESYDNFAKVLQKEIVESLSDRPVILTTEFLVDRVIKNSNGEKFVFDNKSAMNLIFILKMNGYVDEDYKITDKLIEDIEKDSIKLPEELKNHKEDVCNLMKNIHTTANFKAAENDKANNINEAVLNPNENFAKKEFQDLWNKIKVKTVFEVDFDSDELVKKSIEAIDRTIRVKKIHVTISSGEQKEKLDEQSLKTGTSMTKKKEVTEKADSILGAVKYDLVGEITKGTNLTRKTVVRILKGLKIDTFENFRINPENFIKEVIRIINSEKAATLINNITYSKTDKTYTDDVFTVNNFKGSLGDNIFEVKRHIYDFLKVDSKIEQKFAEDLEAGEISVYAKLPGGFKIPTPVGNYNPDWAIVFDKKDVKYVYFIAETKGSMETLQLKDIEQKKIDYARKHFEALDHSDIKYDIISTYQDLKNKVFIQMIESLKHIYLLMPIVSSVDFIILLFTVLGIFVTLISISSSLTKEVRQDLFKKYYFKSRLIKYFLAWLIVAFLITTVISLYNSALLNKINFVLLVITFIWSTFFVIVFILRLNRVWFYKELQKRFQKEVKELIIKNKSIESQARTRSDSKVLTDFSENLAYIQFSSKDFIQETECLKKIIIYSIQNNSLGTIHDFFFNYFFNKPNNFVLNDQLISMFYDLKREYWGNIKYSRLFQDYIVKLVYKQLQNENNNNLHGLYALYIKECIDPRVIDSLKTSDNDSIENFNALIGATIDNLYNLCRYVIDLDISENIKYKCFESYLESLCKTLEWFFLDDYEYNSPQYNMLQNQKEYLTSKQLNLTFIILFLIERRKLNKSFFEVVVKIYKIRENTIDFYKLENMDFELIDLLSNNLEPGGSFLHPFNFNKYRLLLLFYEFTYIPNFDIFNFLNLFDKECFLDGSKNLKSILPEFTSEFCSLYFNVKEEKFKDYKKLLSEKISEKENQVKNANKTYIEKTKLEPKYIEKFKDDFKETWSCENKKLNEFIFLKNINKSKSINDSFKIDKLEDKIWFIEPYQKGVTYIRDLGKKYGKAYTLTKYKYILEHIHNFVPGNELIIKDIYSDLCNLLKDAKGEYFLFYNNWRLINDIPNLQWTNTGNVRAKLFIKESVINFCFTNIPIMLLIEKESFILKQFNVGSDSKPEYFHVDIIEINNTNINDYEKLNIPEQELKQKVNIKIKEYFEIIRNPKIDNPLLKKLKM